MINFDWEDIKDEVIFWTGTVLFFSGFCCCYHTCTHVVVPLCAETNENTCQCEQVEQPKDSKDE